MTVIGWILIVVGALIYFGVKPLLTKLDAENASESKRFYTIKIIAMCIIILGAAFIFIAGGRVNV